MDFTRSDHALAARLGFGTIEAGTNPLSPVMH
jgi:hypothetical protein